MPEGFSINEQFPLRDTGASNALGLGALSRHRWYFFKEGFHPQVVKRAIGETGCSSADLIVDPFCGSGTVPLAAAQAGIRAVAYEVNPFLAFLARTKLLFVKPDDLVALSKDVLAGAARGETSPLDDLSTFGPGGGHAKWLFNTEVLRAFQGGLRRIGDAGSGNAADLAKLALIGAAMDSCNATRDGKCLRYRRDWQGLKYDGEYFRQRLQSRIDVMVEDLRLEHTSKKPLSCTSEVVYGDSRQALAADTDVPFRLAVTSPPYLNSFDYSDIYRPELFLGGYVSNNNDLRQIRLSTLRSHVQVEWPMPSSQNFGTLLERCVERIKKAEAQLWSKRIPAMVQAYFEDLSIILKSLRRRARNDAVLWMVVSTSAYGGIEVPVDLILAEMGSRCGWDLHEIGVLRYLRTSGQHWSVWGGPTDAKPRLRESVVIFHARPEKTRRKGEGNPSDS